jgi:hypothetical protein
MEIGVERNHDGLHPEGSAEDGLIGRGSHSQISNVLRNDPQSRQMRNGRSRQALVQQQLHTLAGKSSTLSSKLAAA